MTDWLWGKIKHCFESKKSRPYKNIKRRSEFKLFAGYPRSYQKGTVEIEYAGEKVLAMYLSQAATNRVCSRCLSLKDSVVGHTDESGVTLPPLHPRCRCIIIYREAKPSTHKGLAAGNIDIVTTQGSPPKLIDTLKDMTPATIKKTLEYYEAQIVAAPIEHAVIITAAGEVYHCNGDVHGIPFEYFVHLSNKLEGAYVTHNHPPNALENDNTFSTDDMNRYLEFKMAILRGIDEKFVYELNRNSDDLDFKGIDFSDLIKLQQEKVKDSHRYIGLLAKINGIGYKRWNR